MLFLSNVKIVTFLYYCKRIDQYHYWQRKQFYLFSCCLIIPTPNSLRILKNWSSNTLKLLTVERYRISGKENAGRYFLTLLKHIRGEEHILKHKYFTQYELP